MGYYIETDSNLGKADCILENTTSRELPVPTTPDRVPLGYVPVVVVENDLFDAAAIAYNSQELAAFTDPNDPRPKRYLLVSREDVIRLNPYVKNFLTWP